MSDELFNDIGTSTSEKELTKVSIENPLIIKIKDVKTPIVPNLLSESSDFGEESEYLSPKIVNLDEQAETEVLIEKQKEDMFENDDKIKKILEEIDSLKIQRDNRRDTLKKLSELKSMYRDEEDEMDKINQQIKDEEDKISQLILEISSMEIELENLHIKKDKIKKDLEDLKTISKIIQSEPEKQPQSDILKQPSFEDDGPPTEISKQPSPSSDSTVPPTQESEKMLPLVPTQTSQEILPPVSTQHKSLIVDHVLLNAIKNKMETKNYKDPFKRFYENMRTKEMSKYIVSITDSNEMSNFNYSFSGKEYEEEKRYSTDKIPVFFRKQKEALTYLFDNDYYKEIKFNNIALNDSNLQNFNPHVFDSFHYNDYIVSSTVSPLFPKDLIMFAINYKSRKYYTCMDFYFDPTFIIDMYIISVYLNLEGPKYVVFNSMETGSLFETYHFHILQSEVPDFGIEFKKSTESFKKDDVYKKIDLKPDSPFAVGYLINLSNLRSYNILYNLPSLLYELRLENKDKYFGQVFFFKQNNIDLLFINFRKVPLEYLTLDENKVLPPQYWTSLYESVNKLYNIVYLPIGLVNYKSKDMSTAEQSIDELLKKPEVIAEMKKPYYHHPKFESKLMEYIRKPSSTIMNSKVPSSFGKSLEYCINLKNDLINNGSNNLDCYKLPILYNLVKRTILENNDTESGLMLIDGAYFYFIITNPTLETKLLNSQELSDKHDLKEIILTNYTSIKNLTATYYLYNPVRTYLLDYITSVAKDNLKLNPSIINSFIVMIVYKLMQLQKKGIRLTNLNINSFYLVENNLKVIDYAFNDTVIVSIAKEENPSCHYKIYHEGLEVFFPFDIKKEIYDTTVMLSDLKNIINQIHYFCKENGINNLLLNDINSTFDRTDYNLDTIIYKFTFGIDYFTCKAPNWEAFERIQNYVFDGNNNDLWNNIVKRLRSTPDLNSTKYPKIEITTDDFFLSGITMGEGNDIDPYVLNELKYNIYNQPTYFFRVKNNKINEQDKFYSDYFRILFRTYAKWNSTSRVYFYKAKKPIKLINFEFKGLTETDKTEFMKNKRKEYYIILGQIFGLTPNQLTRLKKEVVKKYHLQEMLNFGLSIKYPDLAGYKMNGYYDEYIFFRKAEYLSCYSIATVNKTYFELFYDYDSYTDKIKNVKYEDYDKFNSSSDDDSAPTNTPKYYIWLTEEVIKDYNDKKSKLDSKSILKNNKYDFYSLPKQDSKVIYFEQLELKYGDEDYYKAKYGKYKTKYERLKRQLGIV